MYTILKKPELDYLTPDDFLPVLEDIVLNHPALQFLENNITFQERYSKSWPSSFLPCIHLLCTSRNCNLQNILQCALSQR